MWIHFLLQGMDLLVRILLQQLPHNVWPCKNNSPHPQTQRKHVSRVSNCLHSKPLNYPNQKTVSLSCRANSGAISLSPQQRLYATPIWQVTLQFWSSLVLPIFPVILKIYQLPKNNDFLLKKRRKRKWKNVALCFLYLFREQASFDWMPGRG